ncbi:MAG: hypothetical protein M3T96_03370 [Acidobacteriota bacterium]|nr:hypothetical protein [Acidobacteriota bacterium]
MKIAKIVASNSHIDYVARVIDALDVAVPPTADDFGFAQFVKISLEDETELVGVIYDTVLVNPDYANFGPRLSPKAELKNFSPDYLNEQGFLIGILLLGEISKTGDKAEKITHGVPRRAVPAGQNVEKIEAAEIKRFHLDADNGCLQIHYYSQIVAHAGLFAVPLLEAVIEQLKLDCSDSDKQRLGVLKQTLAWQRTLGGMRL